MSANTISVALAHIEKRLDGMVKCPGAWGGPEALELQAVQLLEFRSMVGRPRAFEANQNEVRNLWIGFVAKKARRPYNSPLFSWYEGKRPGLHDKAIADLIKLVRERLPLEHVSKPMKESPK